MSAENVSGVSSRGCVFIVESTFVGIWAGMSLIFIWTWLSFGGAR